MMKKKFSLSTTQTIMLSFLCVILLGSLLLALPISSADGKAVPYLDALFTAAKEALKRDARQTSWDLTLNLVYENGQWWIMPEQALLRAISGGILK